MAEFEVLPSNRFILELSLDNSSQKVDGTFLECQGFQRTQEVIEICEVTSNKFGASNKGLPVRTKIPGNVKSGNITLRRCMSSSIVLWDWFQASHDDWGKQRRNLSLTIFHQKANFHGKSKLARFELTGAWPTNYKLADVSAFGSMLEVEEAEIAFEDFRRVKS